jgi:hypothetical protein
MSGHWVLDRPLTIGMLILAVAAGSAWAQQAPAGAKVTASTPGKAAAVATVKASAVVTAIDPATRAFTLKSADGRTVDLVAGDEVKNYAQVKVGDEVVVEYVRAITLELRKGGGIRERAERTDAVRAEPGGKPGVAAGRRVTVVADVMDVNAAKKTMTLKGPKGNVVELDVRNPDHFKVVKKGDQVEVDYIEALAVTVQPSRKKDPKAK